jgi:hypothetical protein
MDLARGYQSAQYLAHFASRGQWGKKKLNLFHARSDYSLEINRCEDGNRSDLGGRCALGNGFLIALAKQLPLRRLACSRNRGNDAKLLP